jgi:hypothetical protein
MKLIARVWHVRLSDESAIAGRLRIEVADAERVGPSVVQRVDERDIRERLWGRLHRHRW